MRILLIISACCLSFMGSSQSTVDTSKTETNVDSVWVYKFSPLDVFSVVPTFGMDLEFHTGSRHTLQVGAAAIPSFFQILDNAGFNGYDRMGGYRLRVEGRSYFSEGSNGYFAAGVSFRHLIIRNSFSVGMEGTQNTQTGQEEFAYFKKTNMVFHRFNTHLDFKLGKQSDLSKPVIFDVYTGLSLRSIRVETLSPVPEEGQVVDQGGMWRLFDNHKFVYITPIIGVKIGFAALKP